MKKMSELNVKGTSVRVVKIGGEDFVCLTDMAKSKSDDPSFTINHWMRNRMTIEYLGLWESLYNPGFKPTEFGRFREDAGLNSFTLSPSKWVEGVNAIGLVVHSGRYGGTYMENLNAVMIEDNIPQPQRLKRLNEIAIHQMKILSSGADGRNLLK